MTIIEDLKKIKYDEAKIVKKLNIKEDSAVLCMERAGGTRFVLRAYRREIPAYRALTGHSCPYLPEIYRAEQQGDYFIVEEEYIDGICLRDVLDTGAHMDQQRAAAVASAVCGALAALHRAGFIHRDVKPEHVMMSQNRIGLIDLDASMGIISEKANDTRLLGTATYAAPEQFGLTRSDVRTDIFAVGILINELLTGTHPAVTRWREGMLAPVIHRCIQINPQDRYQSAEELRGALKKAETARRGIPEWLTKKTKYILTGVLCAGILMGTVFLTDALKIDEAHNDTGAITNAKTLAADDPDKLEKSGESGNSGDLTVSEEDSSEEEDVQNGESDAGKQTKQPSKGAASVSDKNPSDAGSMVHTTAITLYWTACEIKDGEGFGAPMFDSRVEVRYKGTKTTDYKVLLEDDSCGTAVKESDGRLHLKAAKEGEWAIRITCAGEYSVFYWNTKRPDPPNETNNLTLHWREDIVGPDTTFGAPMLDDTFVVCYNGKPISDYTVELSDPSQGQAVINEDGTLHLIAKKMDEKPLSITYKGKKYIFRWCTAE